MAIIINTVQQSTDIRAYNRNSRVYFTIMMGCSTRIDCKIKYYLIPSEL